MDDIRPLEWRDDSLAILDQRLLPLQEEYVLCTEWRHVVQAIREMAIRGAPAIGLAGAYAVVLAAREHGVGSFEWVEACQAIASARPTAVNLPWAVRQMRTAASEGRELLAEAIRLHEESIRADKAIGAHGAKLLPTDSRIVTICNTGALATGGYGTALGVVRSANEQGKRPFVWVLETRPLLQGMRLTAWELDRLGIPYRIVTDSMAGWIMQNRRVDIALTGADRVAANGDTANKVGTYSLAVLCQAHEVPLYVAAPSTTFDSATPTGERIPIEERQAEEITSLGGVRMAPASAAVFNPAFDVTPASMITGFITEGGILSPPFGAGLQPDGR